MGSSVNMVGNALATGGNGALVVLTLGQNKAAIRDCEERAKKTAENASTSVVAQGVATIGCLAAKTVTLG